MFEPRCTTRFKNAHKTVFRELLYHRHPWFGMQVAMHEAVDNPTSILRFNGKKLALKVLPIQLPVQPRPVGIVTLRSRMPSPVAKLFIDCVRNTLNGG